jgi:hypothetical protein
MGKNDEKARLAFEEGKVWAPISQGRPSKFTEEEMRILMEECQAHRRSPNDRPLSGLCQRYAVTLQQLQRIVRAVDRGEVPFRTRPSMEQREPFSDRIGMKKEIARKTEEFEDKKERRKKRVGFEAVRDILLDIPPGKPIPEGAIHECLTILGSSTESESTFINVLKASREVARQTGEGTHLGPPPPLTDGDMVTNAVEVLHAIGMENSVSAIKKAYGAYVNVTWKKLQKEDHDV